MEVLSRDLGLFRLMAALLVAVIVFAVLVIGRSFLIPLVLAVLLWSLLNAMIDFFETLAPGDIRLPRWLASLLSVITIGLALFMFYRIIASQSAALVQVAPVYEQNFDELLNSFMLWTGAEQLPSADALLRHIDMGSALTWLGSSVGLMLSNLILVLLYTAFLFAEQNVLTQKIGRLYTERGAANRISDIWLQVAEHVQRYVWMKTLISLLTGAVSYVILKLVGVDFAAVWALVIFLLNYIPNIGSMLGVIFPALLTLVQFDNLTPFFLTTVGLGATQFLIGNVVEPAFMGKSLNLSSLMIILSLTLWGTIWGIPGMFLSVPIMVMAAIVCMHFDPLRPIAVILSSDGQLATDQPPGEAP